MSEWERRDWLTLVVGLVVGAAAGALLTLGLVDAAGQAVVGLVAGAVIGPLFVVLLFFAVVGDLCVDL